MHSRLLYLADGCVQLEVNIGNEVYFAQLNDKEAMHLKLCQAPTGWSDGEIKRILTRQIIDMLESKIVKDIGFQ